MAEEVKQNHKFTIPNHLVSPVSSRVTPANST